ncbi:tumor necrosis factor receptor superfamily member 9a isoform X1 [Gadus macrocephalus]|uniref:tumor necrosis factor receptor superfamily member 9a isoform X1 n=1 Tax=Gadus macrocephalus TaxID=80720 RepID=UPI0028CBBEAE|nr:tumor necrosis factor receptor superfamily member 9a isoform X1 [Gadus macrocephalus]
MLFGVIGFLLIHCCWIHAERNVCNTWETPSGTNNVCCKKCIEGYRIFNYCGPVLDDLCVPCENGTFTLDPSKNACTKCRQCGGVQHTVEACTRTKDTQCGCPDPLLCNDKHCSICVPQCGRGRGPQGGYCRPCPAGTFNNQNNQKCIPWRNMKCTHPYESMIRGDAYTDSRCVSHATITAATTTTTQRHKESNAEEDTMLPWWLVIAVSCVVLLIPLILMLKVLTKLKAKKGQTMAKKPPFITTPTDEPRTLMAVECSFHEPEQVSSSESLASENSEDSTHKLIV